MIFLRKNSYLPMVNSRNVCIALFLIVNMAALSVAAYFVKEQFEVVKEPQEVIRTIENCKAKFVFHGSVEKHTCSPIKVDPSQKDCLQSCIGELSAIEKNFSISEIIRNFTFKTSINEFCSNICSNTSKDNFIRETVSVDGQFHSYQSVLVPVELVTPTP